MGAGFGVVNGYNAAPVRLNAGKGITMHYQDERTEEQKATHVWGVVAKDKSMSGWGGAIGGSSRCAWACSPDADIDKLFNWVSGRREMRYVSQVDLRKYSAPRGTAHFHVYVCEKDHPSQH